MQTRLSTTSTVVKILAGRYDISVKVGGTKATTDGKSYTIPDLGELDDYKLTVLRGYIDHEAAGHGAETDFEVVKRLAFEPDEIRGKLKNLFNLIEDIRVEAIVGQRYPGALINLTALNNELLKGQDSESPTYSLYVEGYRQVAGQGINQPSAQEDLVRIWGSTIIADLQSLTSTLDAYRLAKHLLGRFTGVGAPETQPSSVQADGDQDGQPEAQGQGEGQEIAARGSEEQEGVEDGEDKEGNDIEAMDGQPDGEGEIAGDVDEESEGEEQAESEDQVGGTDSSPSGDSDGEEGESGEESDPTEEETVGDCSQTAIMPNPSEEDTAGGDEEHQPLSYEEAIEALDGLEVLEDKGKKLESMLTAMHTGTFREYAILSTDGDQVITVAEHKPGNLIFRNLRSKLGNLNTKKSQIAGMFKAKTAARWTGDREEGQVDNAALASLITGNRRVFRQKYVSQDTDTAVSFLVDFSYSMVYGKKIEAAMMAAVMFLETLKAAGVKAELLGYTTNGGSDGYETVDEDRYGRIENLMTYVFKSFDELYNARVERRISSYKSLNMEENCDPCSVKVAYHRIVQRKEKRKILFVLTDGVVASRANNSKGKRELQRVLDEIEKVGQVQVVCIDMMTRQAKKFYKRVIEVDSAASLPEQLFNGLRNVLKV